MVTINKINDFLYQFEIVDNNISILYSMEFFYLSENVFDVHFFASKDGRKINDLTLSLTSSNKIKVAKSLYSIFKLALKNISFQHIIISTWNDEKNRFLLYDKLLKKIDFIRTNSEIPDEFWIESKQAEVTAYLYSVQ